MKSKRKSITRKIITTLVIVLLMGCSVSVGVGYSKEITAWFYNIQVKLDGRTLNFSKEPFIYDGSVYIPLRDVSQNLGLDVNWDGDTYTVYLASNGTYGYSTTPTYSNNITYTSNNDSDIKDIEDELNEEYEEYTKGDDDLEFEYDVTEESTYIKVKMNGQNFKRDSTDWEKRDDSDFEDFVEEIGEMVADELGEDVKIYTYDKYDKTVGKYEYDEDKDKFKVTSEYEEDDDIDDILDDLDELLEDDYEDYKDGSEDLSFDYKLDERSSYIKVEMEGKNFKRDSTEWENRDKNEFRDFIEDIAQEVFDEIDDRDVRIYIDDEDNDEVAEYKYDEDDEDLDVIDEYKKD